MGIKSTLLSRARLSLTTVVFFLEPFTAARPHSVPTASVTAIGILESQDHASPASPSKAKSDHAHAASHVHGFVFVKSAYRIAAHCPDLGFDLRAEHPPHRLVPSGARNTHAHDGQLLERAVGGGHAIDPNGGVVRFR